MLNKLKLYNFRKHKKLTVEFSPNVTTLQGKSFSGKSTIIRALRWVESNQPSGNGMIRWGETKANVVLWVDENRITRRRTASSNEYQLNDRKFVAFGNNVPEPVAKVLNMGDINFQGQFDAYFWFCNTAGEVSRQLNAIINLNIIDTTLANIASEIRETAIAIGLSEKRIEGVCARKKQLKYVKQMNKELKWLEDIEKHKVENDHMCDELYEIICLGVRHTREKKKQARLASATRTVVQIGESCQEITTQTHNLQELTVKWALLQKQATNIPPSFDSIIQVKREYDEITCCICELTSRIKSFKDKEDIFTATQQNLQVRTDALHAEMKGRCPLCHAIIKNNT